MTAQLLTVDKQYQKALRSFLLTKYTTAASTTLKAVTGLSQIAASDNEQIDVRRLEQLRFSIWTLYLNVATILLTHNTQPLQQLAKLVGVPESAAQDQNQFVLAIWQVVCEGYGGAGNVDPRLVCACLVMTLKLQVVIVGRQIAEQWYASLPDATMDYLAGVAAAHADAESATPASDVYYDGCVNAIDHYVTRILPVMNDYESAMSFMQYNPLITEEKKKQMQAAVEKHRDGEMRERQKKLEQQRKAEHMARLAKERELARLQADKEAAAEQARKEQAAQLKTPLSASSHQERIVNGLPSPALSSSSAAPSEEDDRVPSTTLAPPQGPRSLTATSRGAIKQWALQTFTSNSHAALGILFFVLTLLGLFRGSRGQWPQPIKAAFSKLWQTIQMGTKVTYL